MHLVSKLCCDLSWMTEMQRKNILKNLKIEEGKRKNEVDSIIKEIASKEMDYLRKTSSSSTSPSWNSKSKKDYILPPAALTAACLLEGLEYPMAQGASLLMMGVFIGSFMNFKEVRQERAVLEKERKELKIERCELDKDKFEFDEKKLNWALDQKKIEHQKILMQIDLNETREAYLKTTVNF